jgi:hypothetical protein
MMNILTPVIFAARPAHGADKAEIDWVGTNHENDRNLRRRRLGRQRRTGPVGGDYGNLTGPLRPRAEGFQPRAATPQKKTPSTRGFHFRF